MALGCGDYGELLPAWVKEEAGRNVGVASFDETDRFPFALRGKSAPGMPTFWQEGRSVSLRGYPPTDEIFRDCDCVLVPKPGVVPDTTAVLMRVYGEALRDRYTLVESTPYWDLYVRRGE